MNLNKFKLNNVNFSRENIKMNDNENYPYSNSLNSENKFKSLNMKIPYNVRTNKNLNLEYFKDFSVKNDISSSESRYKKYNFNEIRNNIYGNSSTNLSNNNFDNNKDNFAFYKKNNSFFNNFYNEDIQYMNMKIDLRVIEHKLNCLLNIYCPDDIYMSKKNKYNYEEDDFESSINNNNENNPYENNFYRNNSYNKNNNINEEEDHKNNQDLEENNNKNSQEKEDDNKNSQEMEYDNNSINGQKMEMAIENVVSFNNLEISKDQIEKDESKIDKINKNNNNIIHSISDKTNELKTEYKKIEDKKIEDKKIEENKIEENKIKENKIEENKKVNKNNNNNNKNLENVNNDNSKDNNNNINNINISNSEEKNKEIIPDLKNDSKEILEDNLSDNNNNKNIEYENVQLIQDKDDNIENNNEKDNSQKNVKKVHFDDNLIYINYDEDDYITELELSDKNGKSIPYKERDFTKYLRLLTAVNPKKPQSNIAKPHKKKKKKKKTKFMERNLEFIKQIEKTGNLYISQKDYRRKTPNSESKNCRKFMENPQHFFTEDLCDVMLLQYDIDPKEYLNISMGGNKKSKEKK